jgi:pSer/pThr/pTyr-binding forkhead associated (FHA) protein
LFEKGDTQRKGFLVRISYQAVGKPAAIEGTGTVPALSDKEGEDDMNAQQNDKGVGQLIDDDTGAIIPISGKTVTIGRGEWCGINLKDTTISENHARFRVEYGRNTLEDLSSTNGTRVNLKKIKKIALNDGDKISFGSARFTFKLSSVV